jgi:hypothetical protein
MLHYNIDIIKIIKIISKYLLLYKEMCYSTNTLPTGYSPYFLAATS